MTQTVSGAKENSATAQKLQGAKLTVIIRMDAASSIVPVLQAPELRRREIFSMGLM